MSPSKRETAYSFQHGGGFRARLLTLHLRMIMRIKKSIRLKDVVHLSKDSEILKRRLLKTTPIL
jgi:hypothetical protein